MWKTEGDSEVLLVVALQRAMGGHQLFGEKKGPMLNYRMMLVRE